MRTAEDEIKRLKSTVGRLQRERRKLRNFVREMRWVMPISNSSRSCSYCGEMEHLHNDCDVSRYLKSPRGSHE